MTSLLTLTSSYVWIWLKSRQSLVFFFTWRFLSRGFAVSAEQRDKKWCQRDGSLVYIRLDAAVCGTISCGLFDKKLLSATPFLTRNHSTCVDLVDLYFGWPSWRNPKRLWFSSQDWNGYLLLVRWMYKPLHDDLRAEGERGINTYRLKQIEAHCINTKDAEIFLLWEHLK